MAFEQGNALVVGVGAYQHEPEANVPMAVADARAVAQVLQDAHTCGYTPGKVQFIQDAGATKAGLLTALDELGKRVKREDTVFFFYCGHGANGTDGNYYLVSHDARLQGSRVVAGSGISEAELLEKLRAIKAERMLMVFNTCFAGNISPSLGPGEAEFEPSSLQEETSNALLGTGSGRIIITACRDSQKSYFVRSEPLSIFCQALVDGLRGKEVRNSGGYISAYSLYEMVYEQVREKANAVYYVNQEPELTVLKGVGPFAVALYKGASTFGDFDAARPVPSLPAVRQVEPEKVARLFNQRINTGGGAYIGGSVHTGGGAFVGRDQFNISNSGPVAIGRGAQATVNEGDTFKISGNFQGAILNINSTLENVVQTVGAMPGADDSARAQLQKLVAELSEALKRLPPDKAEEGEAIASMTRSLVEAASSEKPNKTMIQITGEGLKKAAENISAVMPAVVGIATQIVVAVTRIAG